MTLVKKLRFDDDVINVICRMTFEQKGSGFIGQITDGQLERELYVKVDKAIRAMGGKWSRKAQGHSYSKDPRQLVEGLVGNGAVEVAREGWFFTPRPAVERMIALMGGVSGRILEPSAGEGHIIDILVECGADIQLLDCVEKNHDRIKALRQKGYQVKEVDFLDVGPRNPVRQQWYPYDKIFMNPPFEEGQDISHIRHAFSLLRKGGKLVSVISEGPFYRNDKKARDFRNWLDEIAAYDEKLPKEAFKESGATVATRLVYVIKPANMSSPNGQPKQIKLW